MGQRDQQLPRKGRGAVVSPDNRYSTQRCEAIDDGWGSLDEPPAPLATTLTADASRRVISYNDSPDVGFDRSINPYRGCEHGCVYCFARPTHAWLGLSPGLDFEAKLFYKPEAATLLRAELAAPGYRCAPIAVGINTDAYQPAERRLRITRAVLEVLAECRHPLNIVTKSALVERDIDILTEMARENRASVAVSITTLDRTLARRLEPRAAAPERRLETIARLSEAGIPVSVLIAPVIPVLTDAELETILTRSREAGARAAGYVMLRLPHELKEMFTAWLAHHEPLKAEHVMNRVRDLRGGREYDAAFGRRMSGTGPYAELIAQRFRAAHRRLGYGELPPLDCSGFRAPRTTPQLDLF
ncbi:MAG TPA: PA0069 family radical SAM protein [Gammaproteobacteria bacterium]|nr:PA0069 family radical SAM protein [Gammaproteobacteria bacterium]